MISHEVLRHVCRRLGQRTKVSLCIASQVARGVVTQPALWDHVTVYCLNDHALNFCATVQPRRLSIHWPDGKGVEDFLEGLVRMKSHACLEVLSVDGVTHAPRRTHLMATMCQFPELQSVALQMDAAEEGCLAFPPGSPGLKKLRSLHIIDKSRHVEVYFNGVWLPRLVSLHLEVGTSDILASPASTASVTHLTYHSSKESYEDACLDCHSMVHLAVTVWSADDAHALLCAISRARRIDRLSLTCHAPVCINQALPISSLHIRLRDPAFRVTLLHHVLQAVNTIAVEHKDDADDWTVRIVRAGSYANFQRLASRLELRGSCRLVVEP